MLNNTDLFFGGNSFCNRGYSLSMLLIGHEKKVLVHIKSISNPAELTDNFMIDLVKKSLIEPLHIKYDESTRKTRTENGKTVATISIPFDGCATLFDHCPDEFQTSFPRGRIEGKEIKFDVICDDKVADLISSNRITMNYYVERVNKQIQKFNESLPPKVLSIFESKFESLSREHAALDAIGIPEKNDEVQKITHVAHRQKMTRPKQIIIQFIDKMYVQQLDQKNYNNGDVNNAIQSNQ